MKRHERLPRTQTYRYLKLREVPLLPSHNFAVVTTSEVDKHPPFRQRLERLPRTEILTGYEPRTDGHSLHATELPSTETRLRRGRNPISHNV